MTAGARGRGRVIRGSVLSFRADPALVGPRRAVRFYRQGAVVADEEGRIAWRGPHARLPEAFHDFPADDYGEALILPGLIDAHIHFPQYRMIAAPGRNLLDWLERFTFPEERRYASLAHARTAAPLFLDRLIQHGTTAALVFSSVHRVAAEALFTEARRRRQAIISGKTMMDRNAPASLRDDPSIAEKESEALITRWHGRDRLRYAITVRFAITSSEDQLQRAGALAARYPDCLVHSHLSESEEEIDQIRRQFPWAKHYTDVYDRFGLVGANSVFAHGIHLSESECKLLARKKAVIVHCPTSNTFLGSGLFDIGHLNHPKRPVRLAIATDIGGGTSYSMLATMGEAYKVAMLRGRNLSAFDLFHLATRGNAMSLGLGDEIGSLESGYWADLVVLDPYATPVLKARNALSRSLEDRLFALSILGDDRAVRATYIAGRRVWDAKGLSSAADRKNRAIRSIPDA
ncbi:MAG: guanine deaminase [Ectothiorhodospiraceae bacterium AqS1]|nr:guanine deaminase [Ectothiorhodospiraceae bacterium AqS1]